jgi:hypothetical protein
VKLELRAMTNSHLMRERAVMILNHSICEIFLFRIAAHIREGQHRDGRLVR